jgi:hypothetical protein
MDQNSPPHYITPTDQSIEEARDFAKFTTDGKAGPLVTSIVTPRFAPTCSDKLMTNLGSIAKEFNIPIQSHISENKGTYCTLWKFLIPKTSEIHSVSDFYILKLTFWTYLDNQILIYRYYCRRNCLGQGTVPATRVLQPRLRSLWLA